MSHTLSDRAQRMAHAIAEWPLQRVPLHQLWAILDEADPTTRNHIHRRRILADTLAELVGSDIVAVPSARSYDRSEQPPLPKFVTTATTRERPEQRRPATMWHPALAWAAQQRLSPSQHETMERINAWLFQQSTTQTVPLRERSIEILGDEKALDRLILGGLFGPDKLSLALLHARRVEPPLHVVHIGPGDRLLVVENSDTFDSLSRSLQNEPGRVGMVAWGAGAAFEASILSVVHLHTITTILYFGDLDARGLQIPVNASRVAASAGLPPVQPASSLYTALKHIGVPAPAKTAVSAETATTLAAWLAPEHRTWATQLLTARRRVAQEWVGIERLQQSTAWRSDLT